MRASSILAFMLMLTPARAAVASLTEWASAFEQPALGGTGVDVHDRHLVCGHLELSPYGRTGEGGDIAP